VPEWDDKRQQGAAGAQPKGEQHRATLAAMANYASLPGLEHLYLEDSWVLGVYESDGVLNFDLEAVLTEQHPYWEPPKPGEMYCYGRVALTFPGVRSIEWISRGGRPATDASGERDWRPHRYVPTRWGHLPVDR